MPLSCLKNDHGLTLAELLVAMGVSSIVLVMVVTGAVFVEKYVSRWRQRSQLATEASFVRSTLEQAIQQGFQVVQAGDSLLIRHRNRQRDLFSWAGGQLKLNGRQLVRHGVVVDSLAVRRVHLSEADSAFIFVADTLGARRTGLYNVSAGLRDGRGHHYVTSFLVRNDHEYLKATQ